LCIGVVVVETVEISQKGDVVKTLNSKDIDWSIYALKYDLMCDFIPAYQENISLLLDHLSNWELPNDPSICDLGAGTGNFITAIAKTFPDAHFTHVDSDPAMSSFARIKYQRNSVNNVEILNAQVLDLDLGDSTFDVIILINALYAMNPQRKVLEKIKRWLKPNGKLFIIDWGRENKVFDWTWYVAKNAVRNHGIAKTISAFIEGAEVIRQNRLGKKGHKSGSFWRHTTQEFKQTLEEAGFFVEHLDVCYRGYSDLAVCHIDTGRR